MGCGSKGDDYDYDYDDRRPHRRSSSAVDRQHPSLFAFILIAIGVSWFLSNMVGHGVGGVFPLAIGLFLIARSGGGDHYPLYCIGIVLAASGAGHLFGDLVGGGTDALGTLGTAGGFFYLAVGDRRHRSGWAIWPAAILALVGIGQLGVHASQAFNGSPGWIVPAGVVVAGVLLVGAHRLPGPVRVVGLLFVVAAVLSLIGHNNDRGGRRFARPRVLTTLPASSVSLVDYAEKTINIETENGSIIVNPGDAASARSSSGQLRVNNNSDEVRLDASSDNASVTVQVPPGAKLRLKSENGSIVVNVAAASLEAETENGAITVMAGEDQTIAATTHNGSVSAPGFGDAADGSVFAHPGTSGSGSITLTSDNGSIVIRKAASTASVGAR